jgi:hypothetical protein
MSSIRAYNPSLESLLATSGNIDRKFEELVVNTLAPVSPAVSRWAELGKLKLIAADSVVHRYPHLDAVIPRGWTGATWRQADGVHVGGTEQEVVVAQYVHDQSNKIVETPRARPVLLHEFGHGVDASLGGFSRSATFVEAYLADMSRLLGSADEKELGYFTQGFELKHGSLNCAGLSETFAECFAVVHLHCCNRQETPRFRRAFPRTIRLMQKLAAGRMF